jgi:hypothetical protein
MNPTIESYLTGQHSLLDVVTFVYKQLKLQPKLAIDKNNHCYYRHPDDTSCKCAIGHLIPDEEYFHHLQSIHNIPITLGVIEYIRRFYPHLVFNNKIVQLDALQRCHDFSASYYPDSFFDNFKSEIKQSFNIDILLD